MYIVLPICWPLGATCNYLYKGGGGNCPRGERIDKKEKVKVVIGPMEQGSDLWYICLFLSSKEDIRYLISSLLCSLIIYLLRMLQCTLLCKKFTQSATSAHCRVFWYIKIYIFFSTTTKWTCPLTMYFFLDGSPYQIRLRNNKKSKPFSIYEVARHFKVQGQFSDW